MSTVSLLATCTKAWEVSDLSACKPLGLDAATWIAGLTAFAAVIVFAIRTIAASRRAERLEKSQISGLLRRTRFHRLCRAILPLMEENYRIFIRFGPNSGVGDGAPKVVRLELGIWHQARNGIVANNAKIKSLISENMASIPSNYTLVFLEWVDHINAFQAHVIDSTIDYTHHQFPKEVSEIVKQYA